MLNFYSYDIYFYNNDFQKIVTPISEGIFHFYYDLIALLLIIFFLVLWKLYSTMLLAPSYKKTLTLTKKLGKQLIFTSKRTMFTGIVSKSKSISNGLSLSDLAKITKTLNNLGPPLVESTLGVQVKKIPKVPKYFLGEPIPPFKYGKDLLKFIGGVSIAHDAIKSNQILAENSDTTSLNTSLNIIKQNDKTDFTLLSTSIEDSSVNKIIKDIKSKEFAIKYALFNTEKLINTSQLYERELINILKNLKIEDFYSAENFTKLSKAIHDEIKLLQDRRLVNKYIHKI
jgi:hypothetical protein